VSEITPKFDTGRLCTEDLKTEYTLELSSKFAILDTIPDGTQGTAITVTTAAATVLGRKPKLRKPWLSYEAGLLIGRKRKALMDGNRAERNKLKREFNKRATQDRDDFYNRVADDAELALASNNLKPIYRPIRTLCGKSDTPADTSVIKSDGTRTRSEEEAQQRWKEYYEEALNHPAAPPSTNPNAEADIATGDNETATDVPTLQELCQAIKRLKNRSAPGADVITAELLTSALPLTGKILHKLFCEMWQTGRVPVDWRELLLETAAFIQ
jgi:hypothetical protein